MNELDTRAERFLESIRAEGEAACAAIRTETDAEIERQLEETRKAQQAKAEHTLHFETERARTRANRELSAARMQARAKLAAQRQQSFRRVVFMHHPRYHFPDVQVFFPHREQFRNILLYYHMSLTKTSPFICVLNDLRHVMAEHLPHGIHTFLRQKADLPMPVTRMCITLDSPMQF